MRSMSGVGRLGLWVGLFAALSCVGVDHAPPTRAAVAASTECPGAEATPSRLLRQLSLDLRGAPPTPEEYRAVEAQGSVPDATVDAMLRDTRFIDRVKRWHADLLWPSMAGFQLTIGACLAVVPPRTNGASAGLSDSNINPERLVREMDRRSDEAVCPPVGDPNHITAASCCTPANPNHPACCLVRNATYNPADPACVAKSQALPATFDRGPAIGDRLLRGGDSYIGCDVDVEYPPARVAASSTRWPHDSDNRAYYTSARTGQRRYYYDESDIPLPYDDVRTCPNYCRRNVGTGAGGEFVRADYESKTKLVGGRMVPGDGPGYACPAGYTEVVNPCDNRVSVRFQSRVEIRQEGWVLTQPYWASGHWVKTCAYQAQERTVSLNTRLPCRPGIFMDSSCGCGPQGASCFPFTGSFQRLSSTLGHLLESLNREPLEIVASVVGQDEDYATIFTTRRGLANGALAFMNRYQTSQMGEIDFSPSAPPEALPDVPIDDPQWHSYLRNPEHSGVLTTPVFLARFATRRARINRFRTAFLCRPFQPSTDPPPPPEDSCNLEANLARRCGCQYCHASIEPLGAAWGRWAERGTNYLNTDDFPTFDPVCASCTGAACPHRCRHYITTALDGDAVPFLGTLETYLYRSPADVRRIDTGPSSVVTETLASGELQSCTVRSTWERLLNRPMSPTEAEDVLPALVRDFEAHGRSYRSLVRAVVMSPAYRRVD